MIQIIKMAVAGAFPRKIKSKITKIPPKNVNLNSYPKKFKTQEKNGQNSQTKKALQKSKEIR